MDLFHNLLGQKILSRFRGVLVGKDEFGNCYYESSKKNNQATQHKKRWVIYPEGGVEASNIPANWYMWLRHGAKEPLCVDHTPTWVKVHQHNLTGTSRRYAPTNSLLKRNPKSLSKKAYQAWKP